MVRPGNLAVDRRQWQMRQGACLPRGCHGLVQAIW
jgi:hypothetical protein